MIIKFFQKYRKEEKPLLLGLSGGPDSLYLFYQLLEHRIPFAAAHIDHRWRPESEREARLLAELCAKNNVKYYLKTLNPAEMRGNLEDACRNERLAFFHQIFQEGYEAVLLGHHADDQAETVIKRVFEGAGLTALGCMAEVSCHHGMPLWRPLLTLSKAEILLWHKEHNQNPVDDSTNRDPKYLRPRMRNDLLPALAKSFGKEITGSLNAISEEANELNAYMEEKCAGFEKLLHPGPFGTYVDLNGYTHPFEVKYLIRKTLKMFSLVLSRSELHACVRFILEKSGNKWVNRKLYIDRGKIFILPELTKPQFTTCPLSESEMGGWRIAVDKGAGKPAAHWTDVWRGEVRVFLPPGDYTLGAPDPALDKWWTEHKVPAILRSQIPVLRKEGQVYGEFLTGRNFRASGDLRLTLVHSALKK